MYIFCSYKTLLKKKNRFLASDRKRLQTRKRNLKMTLHMILKAAVFLNVYLLIYIEAETEFNN